MREPATILDELRKGVLAQDSQAISALVTELEVSIVAVDRWPPIVLARIKELLQDEAFLQLGDSWKLARFIDNNWDQLVAGQQEEFRDPLVQAFDRHRDWMGAFVIAEILGGRYSDDRALASLMELGRSARMPARALVPHGLESIVRAKKGGIVGSRAIQLLKEMSRSEIQELREEAIVSLERLAKESA